MALAPVSTRGQAPPTLIETGTILAAGKQVHYRIRHLPVNAFPALPDPIVNALNDRGCLIPQSYGAHAPENVVRASFEHAGETDWAVLCSAAGKVSLLVFLASGSAVRPIVLDSGAETSRLQPDDASGELGFDWGIDAVTPQQVHDGQAGMRKRTPSPDHDCIADIVIDHPPTYRCYQGGRWIRLETE